MEKITVGVDYSNICKSYNTAYLDRDNKDPETSRCMQQVLGWMSDFLKDLLEAFDYHIYYFNTDGALGIEEVASKRFLFYSLEKEITLQSFLVDSLYCGYGNLSGWREKSGSGVLIQNDEDGEGVYFSLIEGSKEHLWIKERLSDFSLDEVPFVIS